MIFKKILFSLSVILTFFLLYTLAYNGLWKFHLERDVVTFYNRFVQFSEQGNFSGFDQNEYLPGSFLFFTLPGILNHNISYDQYLNNFIFINLILLTLHLVFYKKINPSGSLYIPLFLLIAFGPILLFRFELIVSLMFLISIYFFKKHRYLFSGLFLGLSFIIKVYPFLILPYFLLLLLKKENISQTIKYLVGIILGVLIPIWIYVYLGGSVGDAFKNLTYQVNKPIGIESVFASGVLLKSFIFSNILPQINIINGIWGFPASESPYLVGNLPYIALLFYYLILVFKIKHTSDFNICIPIFMILTFLVLSRFLNPQYLFWAFGLIPLVDYKNRANIYLILNTLTVLFLTQLVYPIYFTQLLDSFSLGSTHFVFYILQIRNLLMVVEVVIAYIALTKNKITNEGTS